tara:strand:+ start:1062 stop:1451 length:390 start_codon:yes stop_codon:yes gene_type:complete
MATHAGSEGVIKVATNTVAEVRSYSIEQTCDMIEDTAMGDAARTYVTGLTSYTGTIDCFWDETDTNGQVALGIGNSVTLNFYPEGADSGDTYYSGTVKVTSFSRSASFDGMVEASIGVQGSGALTTATV